MPSTHKSQLIINCHGLVNAKLSEKGENLIQTTPAWDSNLGSYHQNQAYQQTTTYP